MKELMPITGMLSQKQNVNSILKCGGNRTFPQKHIPRSQA